MVQRASLCTQRNHCCTGFLRKAARNRSYNRQNWYENLRCRECPASARQTAHSPPLGPPWPHAPHPGDYAATRPAAPNATAPPGASADNWEWAARAATEYAPLYRLHSHRDNPGGMRGRTTDTACPRCRKPEVKRLKVIATRSPPAQRSR